MIRTITITELRRPRDGETHRVVTPLLRAGAHVGSLADARRLAAGYQPPAGDTVEIIERTAAEAIQAARTAAIGL